MNTKMIGTNGANGQSGASPTDGAAGQPASAQNSTQTDLVNIGLAIGGNGGAGGNYVGSGQNIAGGAGGAGGTAGATILTLTPNHAAGTSAEAIATGGRGGNGGQDSAAGGAGGDAGAIAVDENLLGAANANAIATAGAAGDSFAADGTAGGTVTQILAGAAGPVAFATAIGIGGRGGNALQDTNYGNGGAGGSVQAIEAVVIGITYGQAVAQSLGGNGGNGYHSGGNGASESLANRVWGTTQHGTLALAQFAKGGDGGQSLHGVGGNGGDATSRLGMNDGLKQAAQQSQAITGEVGAHAGSAGSGAAGGTAGNAAATIDLIGNASATVTSIAHAVGGTGGSFQNNIGFGADGGAAHASAQAEGDIATATASALGGTGGAGFWAINNGGAGGQATATAAATGITAATASASVIGGKGGNGNGAASAADGASETLANAVHGTTQGGTLTLFESATGGAGGDVWNGGDGGNGGVPGGDATATLSLSDTSSAVFAGTTVAFGGAGGLGAQNTGGQGGNALASTSLTGTGAVTSVAQASAGLGAIDSGQSGSASAQASATGTAVLASAQAVTTALGANQAAGTADAVAIGYGASGTVTAAATSNDISAAQSEAATATATGMVSTSAQAHAYIAQGDTAFALLTGPTIAAGRLAPDPASAPITSLYSQNSAIQSAFGANATLFAVGEVGASHAAAGTDGETATASFNLHTTLGAGAQPGTLLLGLCSGQTTGDAASISAIDVQVHEQWQGGGATVLNLAFTGANAAADAIAAFTDQTYDLGWDSTTPPDFLITLSVTASAPLAGFDGEFLVGNVPAAQHVFAMPHDFTAVGHWLPGEIFRA